MIVRAGWVAPLSRPPIRDGFVECSGPRIVAVGPYRQWLGRADFELPDCILTPGLINLHTHLELSCYAGQIERSPFWSWLEKLVRLSSAPARAEREWQAARDGAWQSLRGGVTCVADISRRGQAWRALADIPIRKLCFAELLSIAADPPRTPQELAAAVAQVPEDELLTAGISPHAPYTVRLDHLRAAIALARDCRRPWTLHLAETREEMQFLDGARDLPEPIRSLAAAGGITAPRCGPGELLARCAAGDTPGILAHGNYLKPEDAKFLAEMRHAVVYCPRTHAFFDHGPHPFRQLQQAGVRVCLGTDSLASNPSLSILEEIRFLLEKVSSPPSADDLLRMATLDAAAALGRADKLGALQPSHLADMAAFEIDVTGDNPIDQLCRAAPSAAAVWVAGQRVI